jgi:hypothetical protein
VDWRILLIPLIPLAIWIIWSIFRAREEARELELRAQRDRERDRPPPPAPKPRRQGTDLDRFRQEALARRSASRAHRDPSPTAKVVVPTPELPKVEDLLRAVPATTAPPPAPRPRIVPTSRPAEPDPEPVAMPIPPPVARQPVLPVAARLRAMLLDRDSLKAAFALREILDRPVSERRSR